VFLAVPDVPIVLTLDDGILVASFGSANVLGIIMAMLKNSPEPLVSSLVTVEAAGATPYLRALFLPPRPVSEALGSGIGGLRESGTSVLDYVYVPGIPGHGRVLKQILYKPERPSSYTTNVTKAVLQTPVWFVNTDGRLGVPLSAAYGPREEVYRALNGASDLAFVGSRKTNFLYIHVRSLFS
jgi:hypothetical protein